MDTTKAFMRHVGKLKRFFCVLLAMFLFCVAWVAAAPGEKATVRVGFYDYGDFMSFNSAGEAEGFCMEYLLEITKYTGWEYEVIDCGSWDNAQAMLVSGDIDLLPATYHTESRADTYLFPELPMCSIYTTLNTRTTDYRYYYEDFRAYNGMRVGVVAGSKDAENFARYCQENHFTVETIPYQRTDDALAQLASGYLDAVAITHLGRSLPFRSVAQFSSEPVFVAVTKERDDLLVELDEAQATIKLRNPDYESGLYTKYFSVSSDQKPVFTRTEQDYLNSVPEITATYDETWAPLSYTDPETGAFSGIVADFFAQISEDTGLKFRFIPAPNYQDALHLSQQDEVDILCALSSDYQSNQKAGITSTQYFLQVPVVLVTTEQEPDTLHRFGVVQGYLSDMDFTHDDAERSITYYSSPTDCFEALRTGALDGVYVNSYTADYMLSKARYHNFSVTTLTNYTEEISVGISTSANPRLFSVLDKAIHFISTEQMDNIILNNSIYPQEITLQALLRQHPLAIILGVVGVFATIILLLSIVLISKSRSNRRIRGLLYTDTLTGLLNLSKFTIETGTLLERAESGRYAIVYIDIKQFRAINDALGFAEGDMILRAMADVLRSETTGGELCGRVSADHFVLLLHNSGEEGLNQRCNAIDKTLNTWAEREGKNYHLVLAFGVYLVDTAEQGDVSLMMDLANYARRSEASATHKSHVLLYDGAMRKEGLRTRDLSDRMQAALDAGEFIPYFQPKVNMATGALVGSEALVRWNFPGKGLIPPSQFIPDFEQNGFVMEVDLSIYEQSCRAIRSWMDEGRAVQPVSCNFSRLHTGDPTFPDKLLKIADHYGIPHEYLELEVTESVFMRDIENFTRQFTRLKSSGFLISIDDFGSGYSSLGLLQRFPVDVIKLDRSFIKEGIGSEREQIILRSVVGMAKDLNVLVVCEGVETLEQAHILQNLGCRLAQGFYYARPMPQSEFEAFWDGAPASAP